jgi:SAM-dependent methyltransferase
MNMVTSTQWQLAREAAGRYLKILEPAILGPFAQALVTWSNLRPGQTAVDVGCGTGAAARYAAAALGPAGRVIGVDVNRGMIEVARSRPPVQGAPIEWYQENAYQLPFRDQTADVVLCAQTLQFLTDRHQALAEMRRILRPGGRLAVSLWRPLDENPYFQALLATITDYLGPDIAGGLKAAFALTGAAEIRALLAGGNFWNVEVKVVQLELDLPPLPLFIPRHVSATPMASAFDAASPAAQQAVIADVARQLAPYQTKNGIRVPFRCHLWGAQ